MAHWLVKSDPRVYSIDDLKRDKTTCWDGVRNYQARNYLKDMLRGDLVLVYRSVNEPLGVVGLAQVRKPAVVEEAQFDRGGKYFDPKASREKPRWFCPVLGFERCFERVVGLAELRKTAALKKLPLLRPGSRLSVMPISADEFQVIMDLADK